MLRVAVLRPRVASFKPNNIITSFLRHVSFRPDQYEGTSEADLTAARQWLASFNSETIPRSICDVSFSRSSGPGGQNVNKYEMRALVYNASC